MKSMLKALLTEVQLLSNFTKKKSVFCPSKVLRRNILLYKKIIVIFTIIAVCVTNLEMHFKWKKEDGILQIMIILKSSFVL